MAMVQVLGGPELPGQEVGELSGGGKSMKCHAALSNAICQMSYQHIYKSNQMHRQASCEAPVDRSPGQGLL